MSEDMCRGGSRSLKEEEEEEQDPGEHNINPLSLRSVGAREPWLRQARRASAGSLAQWRRTTTAHFSERAGPSLRSGPPDPPKKKKRGMDMDTEAARR